MKKYLIVTDTSCDLTEREINQYGIFPQVIPLAITLRGKPLELPMDAVYAQMHSGEIQPGELRTSSCSLSDGIDTLMAAAEASSPDTTIVYAGITNQLSSGTESVMRLAVEQCTDDLPGREFIYCPTYCISNGLGLMLQSLSCYDGDDIVSYAENLGKHIVHLFTAADVSFAARSGRFNLRQLAGLALNKAFSVSPWMYFPCDSNLQAGRPLSRPPMLMRKWAEYYKANARLGTKVRIGYAGAEVQSLADRLMTMLVDHGVHPDNLQLNRISPVVASHAGSSCISLFFEQQEIRDSAWHADHKG